MSMSNQPVLSEHELISAAAEEAGKFARILGRSPDRRSPWQASDLDELTEVCRRMRELVAREYGHDLNGVPFTPGGT